MTLELSAESQRFIESVIRSGAFQDAVEVVDEALRLLRQREELRRDVNEGIAQLEQGLAVPGDEVFARLEARAAAIERQSDQRP